MDKVICVMRKGNNLVVGYTALSELSERQDPERAKGFSVNGGIEMAVSMAVDWLKKEGVVPSRVRDYIDDRGGIVEEKYKEMLMEGFR